LNRVITYTNITPFQKVKYQTAKKSFKIGPVSLNFITIIIISLLSLFYLIQSQQSATKGYVIQDIQKQQQDLVSQNDQLQIQASQLKSLQNIQNTAQSLQMVPTTQLNYIASTSTTSK
jgi:hypothetical protein